jgi:hypothetical protein
MKLTLIPGKTAHLYVIIIKFKANQLLIISDFEDFFSSCGYREVIIIHTISKQLFLVMVELDLNDPGFIFMDDHFYPSDLISWIQFSARCDLIYPHFARLPIV